MAELPGGMTPLASLVITAEVCEVLGKGEEMGHFKFLGSDFVMAIERGGQIEMPNGPANISLMNRQWPEATDRYEVVNRLIWLTALVADGTRIGRSPSHSENHSDIVFKSVVRHATDHDLPWFRFTCPLHEAALIRDRMCGVPQSVGPVRASYNTNLDRMLTFW